jgi:phage terminase Nu1 subunit (DNA packaging protein)
MTVVNQSRLCTLFDVSSTSVTNWTRQGLPVAEKGGRGKSTLYDTGEVHRWLTARELAKRLGDDADRNYDLDQERARLAHYQAEVAKLVAAEKRRELWPVAIIALVLDAMTRSLREKFSKVRETLRARYPDAAAELHEEIAKLHREAFDELREDRLPPDLAQALATHREQGQTDSAAGSEGTG